MNGIHPYKYFGLFYDCFYVCNILYSMMILYCIQSTLSIILTYELHIKENPVHTRCFYNPCNYRIVGYIH